jgi:hypothetical protein
MIASSPLARGLEMLGFGAMEIGRLMADRSLVMLQSLVAGGECSRAFFFVGKID